MTAPPIVAKTLRAHGAHALTVAQELAAAGHQALVAGGSVRDLLLGHMPSDYDIATARSPRRSCACFRAPPEWASSSAWSSSPPTAGNVEVTTFRTEGPYADGRHPSSVTFTDAQSDAQRRDFTINGLFYDPETGRILDYVSGQADLERGIVRAIGEPVARFTEDRLRLVRTARFAGRLGFEIDPATAEAARAEARMSARPVPSGCATSWGPSWTGPGADRGFRALDDLALLEEVLPEVAATRGVPQPPEYHPEGDVWTHVLLCLSHLQAPSEALAWGILLHDVASRRLSSARPTASASTIMHPWVWKWRGRSLTGCVFRVRSRRRWLLW